MQKGQRIEDRHAESWGQVLGAQMEIHNALLLLFSNNSSLTSFLFFKTLLLKSSFSIL
jgi:hypothetical protein